MSDPTYNRKQGTQKYWAMFQREHRKIREHQVKLKALQVPAFDYEGNFYNQLQTYSKDPDYAVAVVLYTEMFNLLMLAATDSEAMMYESKYHRRLKRAGYTIQESVQLERADREKQFRDSCHGSNVWLLLHGLSLTSRDLDEDAAEPECSGSW